ncbi:TetR/AcrR family transcriptional regulator [Sediminibacillus halophilus]|uniref:DNA-binding transcriptional regulator, AcrR family n=1 Tax=Sediminibacillus halophilus TaxID=482461 RepID=A0A1G9X1Q5_9BACI|nr:TetR/AcrR family transcriptional regulator [Sediminibacillus halophilus]SDM90617.1 DNA-binding transcriptional regulator, AcrR family [Sediminibacillus halophilus]
MTEKRMEIIQSAIKCFSRKGYFSTSMQEIADDCGVSKGLLYKLFDSKEDLLIQVFESNHKRMFEKARTIYLDKTLVPREVFKQSILIELEGMFENKDFFNILYKSLPKENNRELLALSKRTRAAMLSWHRKLLRDAYQDKVEPIIWDLTVTLQGIIKEFVQLTVQEEKPVNLYRIAEYIVDTLDTAVEKHSGKQAVLTNELMREYETFQFDLEPFERNEQLEKLFGQLKEQLVSLPKQERSELCDAIDLMEQEVKEEKPRDFLLQALLSYLKQNVNATSTLAQMERLL